MMQKPQNILIPLIVASAMFMEHLDSSILSTALPSIAKALHTEPQRLSMAITSYLLSLAIFIPLSGWIADRFGARTVFRTAIFVFTLSSIGCGFATNVMELVCMRILQGLGGAMMVPVGRLVLFKSTPKSDLVNALAWLTFPALTAPIFGPLVGGFIVTYFSWNWIFFLNVPIGILGMILATLYIDNTKEEKVGPLDVRGFLITAASLGSLVFGFETIGRSIIPTTTTVCLLIGSLLGFALYFFHAQRTINPILDLTLLKRANFVIPTFCGTLFRISIGALPFLVPLLLQVGFGLSPMDSGLLTFSGAIGTVLMKLIAGRIVKTYGFRTVLIINTLLCTLSIAAYALFNENTSHLIILGVMLIGGLVRSLQFTALNALSFADIPQSQMSKATSFYSMMQQLSFSLGVGFAAVMLEMTKLMAGHDQLGANDFGPTILGISFLSILALPFYFRLTTDAGAEVSGHVITDDNRE